MRSLLALLILLAAASVLLLPPADALSATHLVKPDGTGDFATIKEAIVGAAEGDTILLTDGVFTGAGNVDVNFLGKGITVRSQSGDASTCIIDLEGGPGNEHRGFVFHNGEGLSTCLRDITIRNGYVGLYHGGAGISCDYTSPIITGIIFENCSASSGGAVWCVDGGSPFLGQCSFIGNRSRDDHGGAVYAAFAEPIIQDCYFKGNTCPKRGGAIWVRSASPELSNCVFVSNSSSGDGLVLGGGAIHFQACVAPIIQGCTFIENEAPRGGALLIQDSIDCVLVNNTFTRNCAAWGTSVYLWKSNPSIDRTIFAFDDTGVAAIHCADLGLPTFTRCCVFGNASGDSLCGSHSGTVWEDPLFCDLASGDLTLHENSPCMPLNNPHGVLIGAHEQGCGYSAIEERSWGIIKAMYR
jgi:predicted outer membrane repeat protein